MGFPLGSFTLIQFSPPSAGGETKQRRHGRGSQRKGETKRSWWRTARQEREEEVSEETMQGEREEGWRGVRRESRGKTVKEKEGGSCCSLLVMLRSTGRRVRKRQASKTMHFY